ncbi:MerR family transcriptional regulator [Nocardiopsis sediminis]|uniref:MerR family transcriptional regulator n=1 Tax=Nocardiopsis sediminis TaxID=1778267 RepID=A0ABV8FTB4_9ACTN
MLIGELSRRTGVPAYRLRYYEAQGLLEPGRGANGYRDYPDGAVVTVTQIRRLLDAGLSTREIALILPCASGAVPVLEPCPELLAALRERLRGLDEHIDTLDRSRRALRDYLDTTERQAPEGAREHGPAAAESAPA